MKTRGKTIVPRNPVALALATKKSVAHGKSGKAQRNQARIALLRELPSTADPRKTSLPSTGQDVLLPIFSPEICPSHGKLARFSLI